jgi:voltage-gated sodium channel
VTLVERCRRLAAAKAFQNFILVVILAAGVLVGLETYPSITRRHGGTLHTLDWLIIGIFTFEIAVKVVAEWPKPWRFFRDGWNIFDFVVVAVCFLPFHAQYVAVLRLARLLRVIRLVRALPDLQVLVTALLKSLPSMLYIGLLLGLLFYLYGVLGTFLFAQNDPIHFGTLHTTLLTLFGNVTLEGWIDVMNINIEGCAAVGYEDTPELCRRSTPQPIAAVVYFCSFVVIGTMVVLNLFIGVITNSMEGAREEIAATAREAVEEAVQEAAEQEKVVHAVELKQIEDLARRIGEVQRELHELSQRRARG